MIFLLGIYLVIGCFSVFTNLARWFFDNVVIAFLFMPFIVTYQLIYGNAQEKKQAKTIAITFFQLVLAYFVVVGIIMLFQKL